MTRSDLVCARCGGWVAQGRCATCRVARDELRVAAERAAMWLLMLVLAVLAVFAGVRTALA